MHPDPESTPRKAGLRAETYRAWLPPRLPPWAKFECAPGGLQVSRAFRRGGLQVSSGRMPDETFRHARQARSDRATQVANSNLAPGGNLGGVPVRHPTTQPRLARGGFGVGLPTNHLRYHQSIRPAWPIVQAGRAFHARKARLTFQIVNRKLSITTVPLQREEKTLGELQALVSRTTPASGVMGIGRHAGTPHRLTPCGYV